MGAESLEISGLHNLPGWPRALKAAAGTNVTALGTGVFPKPIVLGFLLPIDYTLSCEAGMREGLDGSGYGRLSLLKSSMCIPPFILDSRRQKSPFQDRKQTHHKNTTGEIQLLHSSNSCKRHVYMPEIPL